MFLLQIKKGIKKTHNFTQISNPVKRFKKFYQKSYNQTNFKIMSKNGSNANFLLIKIFKLQFFAIFSTFWKFAFLIP
jgi:hypothetical protein